MNKDFLFATSIREIKSQVLESQITLLVWSCLIMFKSLTEKHRTINHMIIFNDSISKFYQCSIFVEAYLCFLVSASAKEMPRTKFLGILKTTSPRIKYIFV